MRRLALSQLIDLQVALNADRQLSESELTDRERNIAARMALASKQERLSDLMPAELFHSYLQHRGCSTVGARVEGALRLLSLLLFLAGAAAGVSIALGVFAYHGLEPVNVMYVVFVFVGLQLLLLLLLLLSLIFRQVIFRNPSLGALYRVLSNVAQSIFVRFAGESSDAKALISALKQTQSLYRRVEYWLVFRLAQLFGFAFNLSAVFTYVALIAFTDLAFGWSTTLPVSPEQWHRLASFLALPWSFHAPELVPTLELVQDTQYFRLEGRYANAAEGLRAANLGAPMGWWPFILLSLMVYGFMPRLLSLTIGQIGYLWALRRAPLRSIAAENLRRRLLAGETLWRERKVSNATTVSGTAEKTEPASMPIAKASSQPTAIAWRDIPINDAQAAALIFRYFQSQPLAILKAGGRAGDFAGELVASQIRSQRTKSAVVVLVEGWDPPSKAVLSFARALRDRIEADRPIYFFLVELNAGGEPEASCDVRHRATWSATLQTLSDPYTGIFDASGVK